MTTIHNLSEKISEIFPRNPIACLKVIVKNILTYDKVASIEGIRFIPALWYNEIWNIFDEEYFHFPKKYFETYHITVQYLGSKFAPFSNNCVKIAQWKEDTFEFSLSSAHFQCILIKVIKRFVKIRLHSSWRLVGYFDRRLQNTLWNDMSSWSRSGLSGKKQPMLNTRWGKLMVGFVSYENMIISYERDI